MSTPQDPAVRSRQKRRRTKQLAAWREKKAAEAAKSPDKKAPEKKAAAKTATAKKATPKS